MLSRCLPDVLDGKQQRSKVPNLLSRMRMAGTIRNVGMQQGSYGGQLKTVGAKQDANRLAARIS